MNEKRLKNGGAIEFGKVNSMFMALLHGIYYFAVVGEAIYRKNNFDTTSLIGALLFGFSYIILLIVINQLRNIWTVKLIIAKEQQVNKSFLFRFVRYPDYFMNIIPELIGIGLLCKAWTAMKIILPLYLIVLVVRIVQEEKVMHQYFDTY
jgi:isoprenylcysteine carboxyl methyltransferase (ICMT) family protein YpbQ